MSLNPLRLHPIEWFNYYGDFAYIFKGVRDHNMITPHECALINSAEPTQNDLNITTFHYNPKTHNVAVKKPNAYHFPVGAVISKFALLSAIRFRNSHTEAITHIQFDLMHEPNPYIRVGTDYFKVIHKDTRYGGTHTHIKRWKKDEITQDHGKSFLAAIPRYDDFTIVPNNKTYQAVIKNCYNLYAEFPHVPHTNPVAASDIPVTLNFLRHIFGDHFDLGLRYFKILYEHPTKMGPVLCLVSAENETGKTTFINFLEMIFGNNYVLISPDSLTKDFNSNYATKNIIAVEETFIEKQHAVEKIKSLSTGKSIEVNRKFIEDHSIPFFGKIIMNTNKIYDFMRINDKEIRFWVREVPQITGKKNVLIEQQLFDEIPKFLRFLSDLPAVDFDNGSRTGFLDSEIVTSALLRVKEESRSQLCKELEIFICDFFDNNYWARSFYASPADIKDRWFKNDRQVSANYIRKVIREEFNLEPSCSKTGKSLKYKPFDEQDFMKSKVGTPYLFVRVNDPDPIVEDAPEYVLPNQRADF